MAIYKRDDVIPDWEPVPWTKVWRTADRQEKGFHDRALRKTIWQKIPWDNLPVDGIFGHQKDWLKSKDISHFTSLDGEDLFLIDNTWFGFPDPPRWGLVSRLADQNLLPWQHWGHFPDLPTAWQLEGQ